MVENVSGFDDNRWRGLESPFPSTINPASADADADALRWASEVDLVPARHAAAVHLRVGWLAGRTCPGLDVDRLGLAARWYIWFFVFDDYLDNYGSNDPLALFRELVQLRRGPEEGRYDEKASALTQAFWQLCGHTLDGASPVQRRRFLHALHLAHEGLTWEALVHGHPVGLDEYLHMRPASASIPAWTRILEILHGIELDEERDQHAQTLTYHMGLITSLANDLASIGKEGWDDRTPSAPRILRQTQAMSKAAALSHTVELHNDAVRTFVRLQAAAAQDEALAPHCAMLRHMVRGNHDWITETARYFHRRDADAPPPSAWNGDR